MPGHVEPPRDVVSHHRRCGDSTNHRGSAVVTALTAYGLRGGPLVPGLRHAVERAIRTVTAVADVGLGEVNVTVTIAVHTRREARQTVIVCAGGRRGMTGRAVSDLRAVGVRDVSRVCSGSIGEGRPARRVVVADPAHAGRRQGSAVVVHGVGVVAVDDVLRIVRGRAIRVAEVADAVAIRSRTRPHDAAVAISQRHVTG